MNDNNDKMFISFGISMGEDNFQQSKIFFYWLLYRESLRINKN